MAIHKICLAFALILVVYVLTIENPQAVMAAPSTNTLENIHRHKGRPLLRFSPKTGYPRLKAEFTDFIVDDDDLFELSKRQTSDDYGHLRFGKRGDEQFDDYGHMRFGRSGSSD